MYKFYVDIYFHYSWVLYLEVGMLGHIATLSLTFWRTARLFSQVVASFFIPPSNIQGFQFFYIFDSNLFSDINCYLVVFICISLMTTDVGYLFMCFGMNFLLFLCLRPFPKCRHCPWNKSQTPLILTQLVETCSLALFLACWPALPCPLLTPSLGSSLSSQPPRLCSVLSSRTGTPWPGPLLPGLLKV